MMPWLAASCLSSLRFRLQVLCRGWHIRETQSRGPLGELLILGTLKNVTSYQEGSMYTQEFLCNVQYTCTVCEKM